MIQGYIYKDYTLSFKVVFYKSSLSLSLSLYVYTYFTGYTVDQIINPALLHSFKDPEWYIPDYG